MLRGRQLGVEAPTPQRHLFVVVDRTTAFNPALARSLTAKIESYLEAGPAAVTVDSFSAQTRDDFAKVLFEGTSEAALTPSRRNTLNARKVEELDRCLGRAPVMLARRAANESKPCSQRRRVTSPTLKFWVR